MKSWLLLLFSFLVLSLPLQAGFFIDSIEDGQNVLICTHLDQEDILKLRIVDRDNQKYLVLTLRDGEIEFLMAALDILDNLNFLLPPWKGDERRLRNFLSIWTISTCGPNKCYDTKINCNRPL